MDTHEKQSTSSSSLQNLQNFTGFVLFLPKIANLALLSFYLLPIFSNLGAKVVFLVIGGR